MKRRAILALATASALALAACGGDDTTDAETDGTATETAATEPAGTATETEAGGELDLPDPLVLTLTPSQETGGLIETAQPLADILSEELGVTVEPNVPTDYAGVIAALESGQAHVAGGLGPRQMVQSEEQAGARLILQSERFGAYSYVTQWFTNDPDTFCTDEPVAIEQETGEPFLFCNGVAEATENLETEGLPDGAIGADMLSEVAGRTVAFTDQGSTSGYAIPALQLLRAGVDPLEDIDAVFAGAHDNAVMAVYDGDATVGVSFNDARGQVVEQTPDVGQQVVVFGWSDAIPNDGFAVAGSLSDEATQVISDALVGVFESEEGATVMNELYEIEGLAPVEPGTFDVIRELETELGEALG
jgi:phosphonate transport system substrate-binding protein